MNRSWKACLIPLLVLGIFGCAQTRHSGSARESGFLKNYAQLEKGKTFDYGYVDNKTNWKQYRKCHLESVTMWHSEQLDSLPAEQKQALTDYLYKALHRELSKSYTMSNTAGHDTIVLRAAITEAEGANVAVNAITTIIPQTHMLSILLGMTADVAEVVGRTSFEAEVLDSVSHDRLAAMVDRRVGAKTLQNAFSEWKDVQAAYDTWAQEVASELQKLAR